MDSLDQTLVLSYSDGTRCFFVFKLHSENPITCGFTLDPTFSDGNDGRTFVWGNDSGESSIINI